MKVIFLYTEMAGYFLSCLRALTDQGHEATVIHWPVNPEAPFEFKNIQGVTFLDRQGLESQEIAQLIADGGFDKLVCSGWIDKGYLQAISMSKLRIPRAVIIDNLWVGNFKQTVFSFLARFIRNRYFTHAWVAGKSQREFALKLGFRSAAVQRGFYTADVDAFNSHYDNHVSQSKKIPRAFIFVGRYLPHKGIYDLWEAFIEAKDETKSDWKLVCIGTGEDFDKRVEHDDIIHLGFKQPEELLKEMRDTGVFILPSHFEPWGVVVHEFAAAGFPMLLSDKVGAASQFLEIGENGFLFKAADRGDLRSKLISFMNLDEARLRVMSEYSHSLAASNSPEIWVRTLCDLL
jgi:glycosyltransferase involved in cell wall biosynthesis